jgi:hypothetical protein
MLLNTVSENESQFSTRELQGARQAMDLYGMIGYPSINDFRHMVKYKLLDNCTITEQDVINANTIYGPDIASLIGKTTQTKPITVISDYITIPKKLIKQHKLVKISADIMYVQGLMFFVSISTHIKFTTVEYIDNCTKQSLQECLEHIYDTYKGMVSTLRKHTWIQNSKFYETLS